MPLKEKQRRAKDQGRSGYAVFETGSATVFKRRRRIALLILVLLATVILGGLRAYLLSGFFEETNSGPSEQADTSAVDRASEETAAKREVAKGKPSKEEEKAAAVPDDPTLYLTIPRLGLYDHTVRNDRSEAALDLGAIKLPNTDFPWQKGDTNTYIACHRLGWPGLESYNQCLNLPSMQKGDEVDLRDTNGTVYKYRVSEFLQVSPDNSWVTKPVAGKNMVSLQTCIEAPGDFITLGPNWTTRFIVRAERVA